MEKFWKVTGGFGLAIASVLVMGALISEDNVFTGRNTFDTGSKTIFKSSTPPDFQTGLTTTDVTASDLLAVDEMQMTASSVSLTSPTTEIDVSGKGAYIVVNSDANQTGHAVVGGRGIGDIRIFKAGAGSNTLRFDDNAGTMALGGNRTLTEGNHSTLVLINTNADGDNWAQLDHSTN